MTISGVGFRRRGGGPSDKSYAVEARLNALGLYSDGNQVVRYADSSANPVQVGTTRQQTSSPTTINQATPQSLGLTYTVVAAQYRVQGIFFCAQGATASGQFVGWTGPATSFVRIGISLGDTTTNAQNAWTNVTAIGASGIGFTGNASDGFEVYYFGTVTFSAGGTFQPYGQCSNATHTFTIQSGTAFDVAMI